MIQAHGLTHRVLLLIDHLDVGGAQHHVALLAERLTAAGHDVVLAHAGPVGLPIAPNVRLVQLLAERVSRRRSLELAAAACQLARVFRPTIVHAHLFGSAIAGAAVSRSCGAPLVLSHHSVGSWQGPAERTQLASAIRQARFHLAASPQIAASLERAGVPKQMVSFLPNAIEVPLEPAPRPPASKQLRVGYLARLSQDKNPLGGLEAIALARSSGIPLTLEMAGDGELRPDVEAALARLGLEALVKRSGFIRDIRSFFSRVDVLLLPSRSEGMPLAILEAMANEVPVVATRVGAIDQQVNHGVTGLLVEPGDNRSVAQALAWMHRHPVLRLEMGRAGRRRLVERFSLTQQCSRILSTYRLVARESAARVAAS
jgi:glycosyltransferase involved in cell wall biosynthesis